MQLVHDLGSQHGVAPTCTALDVSRATYYRSRSPRAERAPRPTPPRALTVAERQDVLEVLHEPRFVDQSPAEVHATLLDESVYLCSVRSMYRILAENSEVKERRNVARHPKYAAPELLATQPNELWSWDITKLLGPAKWTYYYLYVLLDVFSRYVVGWMVAERESASLARKLLLETLDRQGIEPGMLTAHMDNGAPMRAKLFVQFLADMGIVESHSRPYVSNDNPFSEAQFKTLKYRPEFPDRCSSLSHALSACSDLIPWYNNEHHHASLGYLTPHDVHYGLADAKVAERQMTLQRAHAAHPERFLRGAPKAAMPPKEVWINKPRLVQLGVEQPVDLAR
jgi:putative transposase